MKSPLHRRLLLTSLLSTVYCLFSCRSTPPPTPLDQLNPQQTNGYNVFQTHCAQCHYDRHSGSLHGPALAGIYKKPYLPSGAPVSDERVMETVLHGRGLMPAQPNLDPAVDPGELDDLVAYLHTL